MSAYTIWSRSRPKIANCYRKCRCYTCLAHPDHAILLRRPTTVSKTGNWRKLTTLFYSSLFATAAAADVQAKQSRRDQWDAAIKTAEAQVQEGKVKEQDLTVGYLERTLADSEKDVAAVEDDDREQSFSRGLADIMEGAGVSVVPIPYGLQNRSVGPDSVAASEYILNRRMSDWTPKKLALMELAVAKLALRLTMAIPDVNTRGSDTLGEHVQLRPMLEQIVRKMQNVKEQDTFNMNPATSPGLPQYTPNTRAGPPGSRNKTLDINLLKLTAAFSNRKCDLPNFLTGITQNLLAARYPPEISSMTMILSTLSNNEQFGLADAVADCIEDSKLRPDEMGVNAILNHFITADNEFAFNRFRLKMKGFYGGLAQARNIRISRRNAHRLRAWNGKVLQSIENDRAVWHSIIRGQLHFGQLHEAVDTYYAMTVAGFLLNRAGKCAFIEAATMAREWQIGMAFWGMIRPRIGAPANDMQTNALGHVVRLCEACGRQTERDMILQDLGDAVPHSTISVLKAPTPWRRAISPSTEMLRRQVLWLQRQAEQENIRFHRRGRLVIGTLLRLRGFTRSEVIEAFREAAHHTELKRKDESHLQRVSNARRIMARYGLKRRANQSETLQLQDAFVPEIEGKSLDESLEDNQEVALVPVSNISLPSRAMSVQHKPSSSPPQNIQSSHAHNSLQHNVASLTQGSYAHESIAATG